MIVVFINFVSCLVMCVPHSHMSKEAEEKRISKQDRGLHNLWQPGSQAARKWRENEKMKRKWRENEERERKWRENEEMERDSLHFLIFLLFPSSLSISYIKNCLILLQNVANVTKNLTYAL